MYIQFDDAMGLWAVLTDDDRLLSYFYNKMDAESFLNGMKSFINTVGG
jgi:hypothetical protein